MIWMLQGTFYSFEMTAQASIRNMIVRESVQAWFVTLKPQSGSHLGPGGLGSVCAPVSAADLLLWQLDIGGSDQSFVCYLKGNSMSRKCEYGLVLRMYI